MHAINSPSRLAAAITPATPTIPMMSQNVPKCPTFFAHQPSRLSNQHAADNPPPAGNP